MKKRQGETERTNDGSHNPWVGIQKGNVCNVSNQGLRSWKDMIAKAI